MLKLIEDICQRHQLISLVRFIKSAQNTFSEKYIDVSILGQFKAGKSSFINSIIKKDILPTAVIPATSVITRIYYGKEDKAFVELEDGRTLPIHLNEIADYVTEARNPKNVKQVKVANIEYSLLKELPHIRLIDTPGVGSIYLHNTQITKEWSSEIAIAIVCISAERPLSESDVELIHQLLKFSYRIVILITKCDLFNEQQINEIKNFLSESLYREFNREFEILTYSTLQDTDFYRDTLINQIFRPLISSHDNELEKIRNHKLKTLVNQTLNYLEIAYQASLHNDKARQQLKQQILDEKLNIKHIQHELQLITSDAKSRIRRDIYNIFQPYEAQIIQKLQGLFNENFSHWKGNLYHITRKFEEWLKEELKLQLKEISDKESQQCSTFAEEIYYRYNFYTKSFRERLNENIRRVLGITFSSIEWQPEYKPFKNPDVSVYRAFDNHLDLLWFLFPMILFRNVFRKHFYHQIPREVEKNIYRLTSDISEVIHKQIEISHKETLKYLINEIQTLETTLLNQQNTSEVYEKEIKQ